MLASLIEDSVVNPATEAKTGRPVAKAKTTTPMSVGPGRSQDHLTHCPSAPAEANSTHSSSVASSEYLGP